MKRSHAASKRRCRQASQQRRAGILALGESPLLVLAIAGICWLTAHFLVVGFDNRRPPSIPFASDRGVYQIAICDSNKIWVYRPHQGISRFVLTGLAPEVAIPKHDSVVAVTAFSGDGHSAFLCHEDGRIHFHCEEADDLSLAPDDPEDAIVKAVVSQRGTIAVCATASGRIRGWNLNGLSNIETSHLNRSIISVQLPLVKHDSVLRLAVDRADTKIYAATHSGRLFVYDMSSGELVDRSLETRGFSKAIAILPEFDLVAAVSPSNQFEVFSMNTGRLNFVINGLDRKPDDTVTALEFSPDGRRIGVATTFEKSIQIIDLEARTLGASLYGHSGIVRTIQFTSNSERLYSGSYDGTIREWSLTTPSLSRILDI